MKETQELEGAAEGDPLGNADVGMSALDVILILAVFGFVNVYYVMNATHQQKSTAGCVRWVLKARLS